jgi:hypothetical protein
MDFAKRREKDYESLKKNTLWQVQQAKTTLTLLDLPNTAIWDVATVVWFLKTIDPTSVARESEVASVEEARSLASWLAVQFAKLKDWTKLSDVQRTQIKDAINAVVNAAQLKYDEETGNMVQEFNDRWLDASVYIPKTEVQRLQQSTQTYSPAEEKIIDDILAQDPNATPEEIDSALEFYQSLLK